MKSISKSVCQIDVWKTYIICNSAIFCTVDIGFGYVSKTFYFEYL